MSKAVCDRIGLHLKGFDAGNKKRKFLVKCLPDDDSFSNYQELNVVHNYLASNTPGSQARIRKSGQSGTFCLLCSEILEEFYWLNSKCWKRCMVLFICDQNPQGLSECGDTDSDWQTRVCHIDQDDRSDALDHLSDAALLHMAPQILSRGHLRRAVQLELPQVDSVVDAGCRAGAQVAKFHSDWEGSHRRSQLFYV